MPAILMRPSCRSRKKVSSSGSFGEAEFATDRFFNLFAGAAVVVRELVRGFTGLEAFGHDVRADTSASDHGFPEGDERINHNIPWFVRRAEPGKRIKAKGETSFVALNS